MRDGEHSINAIQQNIQLPISDMQANRQRMLGNLYGYQNPSLSADDAKLEQSRPWAVLSTFVWRHLFTFGLRSEQSAKPILVRIRRCCGGATTWNDLEVHEQRTSIGDLGTADQPRRLLSLRGVPVPTRDSCRDSPVNRCQSIFPYAGNYCSDRLLFGSTFMSSVNDSRISRKVGLSFSLHCSIRRT